MQWTEPAPSSRRDRLVGILGWVCVAAALTIPLSLFRGPLEEAHMALAYLLVVLGASAREGRAAGLTLALLCFLAFDFFLLRPYYTLKIALQLDWLILGAFLTTSIVAAELLHRAQRAAQVAERRAREIDRLSDERAQLAAEAERVEALKEADRLKDALLASVSHDLRTPLTTIKALASDIGGEGDDRAATIEAEADRLNRVVADLLDISRLRAGELPITAEITAADDVLGAALKRVSGNPAADRIEVTTADSEHILFGRFDFVHTLRALVNLIDNALRHSPPETSVNIRVERRDGEVCFLVGDRGPGIPADERDQIFEPFHRLSNAADDGGGTGLGLSIALRLAEAQDGTVEYSERPGGGSIFTLHLPAADIEPLETSLTAR